MAKEIEYEVSEVPKKRTQDISLADLVAALQALKGDDDETLKKRAKYEAEALARIQGIENKQHPDKSVYNPEGERDHPRPDLKCRMTWLGTTLEKNTLSRTEIDLLNQVERVGTYVFRRTDNALETMHVTGERDANGQWLKLAFVFDARGDKKHNLPPMTTILKAILGQDSEEAELRKRIAELEALVA